LSRAHPVTPDLETLVALFFDATDRLADFEEVPASALPAPYRTLLAHNNHMTVTVESWHGCPVDVRVLEKRVTDEAYARKILLARQSDGEIVQFGIMRIKYDRISSRVRAEIESERTPLGRILIQHNLLREVELASLWKVAPAAELQQHLQMRPDEHTYGRTALIHVDGEPAVELLEIVAPVRAETIS